MIVLWNAEKKYQDNCTLLYTDTDSLLVDIKTEDIYKNMSEFKDEFDFLIIQTTIRSMIKTKQKSTGKNER